MNNELTNNLSSLIGRVLISAMFIMAGYGKITGYEGTQGFMESVGVPGILLPLVIALELLGGIAVLLGYQIKITAFLLGGFTLIATFIFHSDFSQPMQSIIFMKNLAIVGGFMVLFAQGAGGWSLDAKRN